MQHNMELEVGLQSTVYGVSYQEENVGRIFRRSKTRVTWTFVASGGREHWVVLTWSKSTGKQDITMDGDSVWFGRNQGSSVLDHNWTTSDRSLRLHVLATCAPKLSNHFRCYDLLINGQLFATLPLYKKSDDYLDATEMPWMAQNQTNRGELSSIIQILYPEGYIRPVDKNHRHHQQQQQQQHPVAIGRPVQVLSDSSNSVSNLPMADLLM